MSRTTRFVVALTACAVATSITSVASMTAPAQADPVTQLNGSGPTPIPLKNAAMILKTKWGYRYIAGQQDSNLTISEVDGRLLYVDTGTQELRKRPKKCKEQAAPKGIAVLCKLPKRYVSSDEMFLEIWPRLGDDVIDGSTLPAKYRMWVLGDKGNDTVYGGAGDDFFNGAQDNDTAYGGAGDDWLRTGLGDDVIWGGDGNDKLVGVVGDDEVHGGAGNDRVGGGPGADTLYADSGKDVVACGGGRDDAYAEAGDKTSKCETVSLS